jgi:hypothetical protein
MALIRGNLGFGIPSFIKEGLNPIAHVKTGINLITHPVDTVKTETGKALAFTAQVAQPWVGGPSGVGPDDAARAISQSAAQLTQVGPPCGFFDRLSRLFGGHPNCT